MNKRVMNLVNFVRGCEPRKPMDLLTPIAEEIKIEIGTAVKDEKKSKYYRNRP